MRSCERSCAWGQRRSTTVQLRSKTITSNEDQVPSREERMDKHYDVTAVISTYNQCETLLDDLKSALSQRNDGVRYEIIVVDNNSNDSTREVVQSYLSRGCRNLRYVFEPKQGSSFARNTGIAASSSDIIAFADDDVRVSDNWILSIKRAFEQNP